MSDAPKNARKIAFGLALLGASLGAGIGLANAQTDTTQSPTTQAPTTEAPATTDDGRNCPEKDGTGTGAGTGSGAAGTGAATATNAVFVGRRA